ncbi:glycosyl transferase group 1 protein [Rutstroemia sp. NJR-2017a WRK4]|nr:glycosyl transferase group 1 protein [Rutstroemia sp. NJR-2017a WRK4]
MAPLAPNFPSETISKNNYLNVKMLPAILVLNDRYYPSSTNSPAKVGATAFALQVARAFDHAGLFAGVILYERLDHLKAPIVQLIPRDSTPCVKLSFHFDMSTTQVRYALDAAAALLVATFAEEIMPMLYYQTDTLLKYHPKRLPYCVTHHGPFYGDFTRHFTRDLAAVAYGSEEKAAHLERTQEEGLRHLKACDHAYVLQHSYRQGEYLMERGVDPARMRALNPPIHSMRVTSHRKTENIRELVSFSTSKRVLVFTAVARLDYFKNIELLVDSVVTLLGRGRLVRLLVVGGEGTSDRACARLLSKVPREYSAHVKISSKIAKDDMYSLFDYAQTRGIFVCTSRYETLALTPLESALSGVTTIMPDSELVEASRYFPDTYRFEPTAFGLAAVLDGFLRERLGDAGMELQRYIDGLISEERFVYDLMTAWADFSQHALQMLASTSSAPKEASEVRRIGSRRNSM